MAFVNIDAPGNRHDRRAVAAIQRRHGAEGRKDAAQQRRDRRRAKRAAAGIIDFFPMPKDGVSMLTPDGAYAWGGNDEVGGRYQIIVIGEPVGPPEIYRAALAVWTQKEMALVSAEPLPLPDPEPGRVIDERKFLSIIVEPQAQS